MSAENASAQQPNGFGFLPFGFYQPYGATYGTSLRTPPYFATNPPVYYGARHSRPYGLSPFAAPPQVSPGANYRSRLRTQFDQPAVPTPQPLCNPCVSHSKIKSVTLAKSETKMGPVRTNPFSEPENRIAKN
jgi:hypothetical protein